MALSAAPSRVVAQPETLCILDFNRLGDEESADWLKRGLADMMITTMNRLGPYRVLNRQRLKEILAEHQLLMGGFADMDTAFRQARLAKAQLLLVGNFALQGDAFTVQVRLLRTTDQRVLSMATWTGSRADVLAAPEQLVMETLANLAKPIDATLLAGIESEIPRTIDVAQAFYRGVEAFDNGEYPKALAYYLEGAREANTFFRIHRAVLKMFSLLGQYDHAVVYAMRLAQALEQEDLQHALEFYFVAAEQSHVRLTHADIAIRIFEKSMQLARAYNRQTGGIEHMKALIKARLDQPPQSNGKALRDHEIQFRIWYGEIDDQLRDRQRMKEREGYWVQEDKTWKQKPVPDPSVFMWKVRAQRELARLYVRQGDMHQALAHYQEILRDYDFINTSSAIGGSSRFYWDHGIRTEAHFMILHHYKQTGQLVRDAFFMHRNRTNVVDGRAPFRREFTATKLDPRARAASLHDDGGHEYYDFSVPQGYQIDAVRLEARVTGVAKFSVNLPNATGWPPQYAFSKRLARFQFGSGTHTRTIAFPAGTEFFSIGTSWGCSKYDDSLRCLWRHLRKSKGSENIRWWKALVTLSPKQRAVASTPSEPTPTTTKADKKLITYRARKLGWEDGVVIRDATTRVYAPEVREDVYAKRWFPFSLNGDIYIYPKDNPRVKVHVPVTINTPEDEFNPSVVKMHDGRIALLWTRGVRSEPRHFFYATTKDFITWETPQRMGFATPKADLNYHYGRLEPLARSYNVVPIPDGYLMLLAQGFVRYSKDLKHWDAPKRVFDHDGYRNRIMRSRDDRLWVVDVHAQNQEVPSQDAVPKGFGFMVTGDGKIFIKRAAIRVWTSVDGKQWTAAKHIHVDKEPSGLWVFPVMADQIAIAVQYNNYYLTWFRSVSIERFQTVDSPVRLLDAGQGPQCYVGREAINCAHVIHDDVFEQKQVILILASERLFERMF